jgi:nickel/cobalt exporter
MTDLVQVSPSKDRGRILRTAAVACVAIAVVILIGAAFGALVGAGLHSAPAPKNPFGVGLREGGAATNALAAWILDVQSAFSRATTAALRALKTDPAAVWSLVGLSFAYGVFHAAGPGHGKAVVGAYVLAEERALKRGLAMSLAAAMLQASVAVAVVSVLALIFSATARTMTSVTGMIETFSFAAVAAVGAVLLWRKAGSLGDLLAAAMPRRADHAHQVHHHHRHHRHHHHTHDTACGCGHDHAPRVASGTGWKGAAAAVTAAGIRPCSGAIVVLVFALSQGLFAWGILAAFAMGLGVAMTTGALATLAVVAKAAARRMAGGEENQRAILAVRVLETVAAALVLALGLSLLIGVAGA